MCEKSALVYSSLRFEVAGAARSASGLHVDIRNFDICRRAVLSRLGTFSPRPSPLLLIFHLYWLQNSEHSPPFNESKSSPAPSGLSTPETYAAFLLYFTTNFHAGIHPCRGVEFDSHRRPRARGATGRGNGRTRHQTIKTPCWSHLMKRTAAEHSRREARQRRETNSRSLLGCSAAKRREFRGPASQASLLCTLS